MSDFVLSQYSLDNLQGVNGKLVQLVKRAIELTSVDFTVTEGRRTHKEQVRLVNSGASQTMNSRHLTGDAVDVAAYVAGRYSWHVGFYYPIATSFQTAALEQDLIIRWGGCWRVINQLCDIRKAVCDYIARCYRQNREPFLDLPHFEVKYD